MKKMIAMMCFLAMSLGMVAFAEETDVIPAEETIREELSEEVNLFTNDKTELEYLIQSVSLYTLADITEAESLQNFETMLAQAEEVYASEIATEEEIAEAITRLKEASEELVYLADHAIISANAFSEEEKTTYYEGMNILGDVCYTYIEAPEGITGADTAKTKLTDGLESDYLVGENTGDTVISFDLGKCYYLTGADVFSRFYALGSRIRRNIGGFSVLVSADGDVWNEISKVTAKTEPDKNSEDYLLKTDAQFGAVYTRYVRIVVTGAENSTHYSLKEIVLIGFESPFSKDKLYEKIVGCADVDGNIYTKDTYQAYQKAYREAEAVYWDAEATGNAILNAQKALEDAYANLKVESVVKILSGNLVSSFDKEFYAEYKTDKVALEYYWEDISDADMVANDVSCVKLLSGTIDAVGVDNIVHGKWNSPAPASLVFDLGEECYVTGVDFWEHYKSNTMAKNVSIEVSDDGESFRLVSETTNPNLGSEVYGVSNLIAQDFPAEKCRYLRIRAYRVNSQLIPAEIVIKGYRVKTEAKNPYIFGAFDYKNADDERIISLENQETVTVSGTVKSNLGKEKTVVVMTVAYDDENHLVDWTFQTVTVGSYAKKEFSNTLQLENRRATIYTYVWDLLESGRALSEKKAFGTI